MTNNKTKGFILGAIAAASYGMNPLFTLPLYSAGMSVDTVLFYRYSLAVIVLGIMMKFQKQSFAIKRVDVLPLCIMGLLFAFSSLFLFMSYNYMDAGIASTILFVYPVLVAIIMAVVFKEKVSPITMFCLCRYIHVVQESGRTDTQPGRNHICLPFFIVLCHLYSGGQSLIAQRYADCQTYLLCFVVRIIGVCSAFAVLYRIAGHSNADAMDKCCFAGSLSYCHLTGDND